MEKVAVKAEEEVVKEMDEAIKAGKISVIFNLLFSIFKGFAGFFAGSIALLADALHSLIDVFGSLLVWAGIKVASKPADSEHPYGHFKAESLAELGVGIIIILSSVLIIKEAIEKLFYFSTIRFEYYAALTALASAFGNEILARYKISTGKKTKSSALIAEGKHSRADVLSSLSVFAGLIFVKVGYQWADPLIAILISVMILQMGFKILRDSADSLLDRTDRELAEEISNIVQHIEGVESVKKVRTRGTLNAKIAEVEFNLKPWISTETIEELQEKISSTIKSKLPEVYMVIPVVHFVIDRYRIAIPSAGEEFTEEFGTTPEFTVFDVNKEVINRKIVPNPYKDEEKKKGQLISELLRKEGVNVVAVKKIGEGGKAHLRSKGISIKYVSGERVDEVINNLLKRLNKEQRRSE